jgi:colanic acid biosynthesis protein WcaH
MSAVKSLQPFSQEKFLGLVHAMPLISIDLVIVRNQHEVLLGLRNNRPAQGFWFVPGGRIFKDELMQDAIVRICEKELALAVASSGELKLCLHGVYEHMYEDCFAGDVGISTHYVVIAHKLDVSTDFSLPVVADDQHAELKWWPIDVALASDVVHQYTKNYFLNKERK